MRFAAALCLFTLLAGCGVAMSPVATTAGAHQYRHSWMQDVKGENLLYVSNSGELYVYTFPHLKFLGVLSGASGPRGICSGHGGDIFVPFVYIPGGVYVYAHGSGSPFADLGLLYDWPNGCSVDPLSGSLAVVSGPHHDASAVAVYRYGRKHGWRFATGYGVSSLATTDFCGYDDKGNLFVDGLDARGNFGLAELPKGGIVFRAISISKTIVAPGQVQWDGKHLAIGDDGVSPAVVYQFDVSGSSATAVGSTTLHGSENVQQFWIQGRTLVAPDPARSCGSTTTGCIALYRYPAGGAAVAELQISNPFGAAVSLAQP